MYVSTVLFEKHSPQSITLVALRSSWCSSKVFVHGEEVFKNLNFRLISLQNKHPSKHSCWWRRLEDVFRLRLQKTSSRCLDQDEHVRLSLTSAEDVLVKTNIFVLAIRLQDVFKMTSRRFQDIFKTSSRRFEFVFKTSCKDISRRFQGVSSS